MHFAESLYVGSSQTHHQNQAQHAPDDEETPVPTFGVNPYVRDNPVNEDKERNHKEQAVGQVNFLVKFAARNILFAHGRVNFSCSLFVFDAMDTSCRPQNIHVHRLQQLNSQSAVVYNESLGEGLLL